MTSNALKALLAEGRTAVGAWCALSDSLASEIVAHLDADYVCIDMQHGVTDYPDLIAMLQGIGTSATPLVRIPDGGYGLAQRALDAGAEGIIFPLVDDAKGARRAVDVCRYPPLGRRSFGPVRAGMHLGSDTATVNVEILCLVQVETTGAIHNLDEIASVEGVDGLYVGPADLALAHGLPMGQETEQMEDLMGCVVDSCNRAGLIPATHTSSGAAAMRAAARGFRMTTVGNDVTWLRSGYAKELAAARDRIPDQPVGYY
jgi:4-hydroxy-2-oxoheptanedioate aldolase